MELLAKMSQYHKQQIQQVKLLTDLDRFLGVHRGHVALYNRLRAGLELGHLSSLIYCSRCSSCRTF